MDVFQKSSFFFPFPNRVVIWQSLRLKKNKELLQRSDGTHLPSLTFRAKVNQTKQETTIRPKNKKKPCISQERPRSGKLGQFPERVCPAETLVRRPCVRCSTAAATTSSGGGQCKWSRSSNGMAENKDTLHATCGYNMMMCAYILCMCRMISGSFCFRGRGRHWPARKEGNASADIYDIK